MNEPETTTPVRPDVEELKETCAALRHQATTLLLALIVVSGTLTVHLGLQARRTGRDLEVIRPQAIQMMEYSKREEPQIADFVVKLTEFGRTHPDFQPILSRFKIQITPPPGAATNPAASTAKPAGASKK